MVPSVNVPVALNCCVVLVAIEGFVGVTAIHAKTAGVTVRVAVPVIEPDVAVMFAVPVPTLLANPSVPALLLIVAMPVADELHCTDFVTSCVLVSVNVPVAAN